MQSVEPITAIMIGAGDRGKDIYGRYAAEYPKKLRFMAVAEPLADRRESFARQHQIPNAMCFESWESLLDQPKLATAAFICTQDQLHSGPAQRALGQKYHVLLEKPMATTAEDCRSLVAAANEHKRHLQICHVLRYSPFFQSINQAIQAGLLGEIICLTQRENVGYYHMAHSFVRGNWRNRENSNPMILAKCCHDLDLLHWLVGSPAKQISSIGNLMHFRPDKAPNGSTARCTDGCMAEVECIFSAIDIYVRLTPLLRQAQMSGKRWPAALSTLMERYPEQMTKAARFVKPLRRYTEYSGWPVRVMSKDFSRAGRLKALQDPANPYGRCVYACDNDVVDHQHVNIDFENGVTATLIMHGHSYAEGRSIRIDGSAGTLFGELYGHQKRIVLHEKRSGKETILYEREFSLTGDGHGGGDEGLMENFVNLLQGKDEAGTDAGGALESHLMAFAADRSRIEKRAIQMEAFR